MQNTLVIRSESDLYDSQLQLVEILKKIKEATGQKIEIHWEGKTHYGKIFSHAYVNQLRPNNSWGTCN